MSGMGWTHKDEKTAEERGYVIASIYDTKDEIDHVISKIHGCGAHAFKAHHTYKRDGFDIDEWVLYVKLADLHMLRSDYKPPEKPPKPLPKRGGRRKDMAIKITKMRKEDNMSWEDIAKELNRSVSTVKDYYYRNNCKAGLTDWKDDLRPEGYEI